MQARMTTAICALAAAMAATMAGSPAATAAEVRVGTEKVGAVAVSYGPAALAGEAGARDLLTRLEAAARTACGGDPRNHSAWRTTPDLVREAFRACRRDAVARAVAEVGSSRLAALHAGGRDGRAR